MEQPLDLVHTKTKRQVRSFGSKHSKGKDIYSNFLLIKFQRPNKIHGISFQRYVYCVFTYLCAESYLIYCIVIFLNRRPVFYFAADSPI